MHSHSMPHALLHATLLLLSVKNTAKFNLNLPFVTLGPGRRAVPFNFCTEM